MGSIDGYVFTTQELTSHNYGELSTYCSLNSRGNCRPGHAIDRIECMTFDKNQLYVQTTFRKFYGRHTDLIHKFDTLCHIIMLNGLFTNCDIHVGLVSSYVGVNRDGCLMWGRKCSHFPEHLISLPLGSS